MLKPIRNSLSNSPIPEIPISQNNEGFLYYKSPNSSQLINKKPKNKSSDFLNGIILLKKNQILLK